MLRCADVGDPPGRERFFRSARRDRATITWPGPTRSHDGASALFGHRPKWKSSGEYVIDFSLEGVSIFNRPAVGKKPLSTNTMRRIYKGLFKFGLREFLVNTKHTTGDRLYDTTAPAPTVPSESGLTIVKPFLVNKGGPKGSGQPRSTNRPMKTIMPDDHTALIEPLIVLMHGTGGASPTSKPTPTVIGGNHLRLVESFVLPYEGRGRRNAARAISEPMPTSTQRGIGDVVQPLIIKINGGADGYDRTQPTDTPAPTITTQPTPARCAVVSSAVVLARVMK